MFIWVDKDFAMVRGHLQGYPKKLGSIQPDPPGHRRTRRAAPRAGGRFAVTLAAYDRRLAEATVTLTREADAANGFVNGRPMLHHRWSPRIEVDGTDTLCRGRDDVAGVDVELGPAWRRRRAELELFDSPVEELTSLAPREVLGGYCRTRRHDLRRRGHPRVG